MKSLGPGRASEREKRLGAMAHGGGAIASLAGLGALPAALVWALARRSSPFAASHAKAALAFQLALALLAAAGSLALIQFARASLFAIAFKFLPCVWIAGALIAAIGVNHALKGEPVGFARGPRAS